ncbi:MAG TPA: hypothetical protein VGB38_03525 [bacterium]
MESEHQSGSDNAGVDTANLVFCDARCEHADFPRSDGLDGSGSCRTFAALFCKLLEEHVTKNAPCTVRFGKRRPKTKW